MQKMFSCVGSEVDFSIILPFVKRTFHKSNANGRFPLIHLLSTTTRMPIEILSVMLIGVIVFPFALGIQSFHENEKTAVFW